MFLRRVQLFFLFYAKFFLRKGREGGHFPGDSGGEEKSPSQSDNFS